MGKIEEGVRGCHLRQVAVAIALLTSGAVHRLAMAQYEDFMTEAKQFFGPYSGSEEGEVPFRTKKRRLSKMCKSASPLIPDLRPTLIPTIPPRQMSS